MLGPRKPEWTPSEEITLEPVGADASVERGEPAVDGGSAGRKAPANRSYGVLALLLFVIYMVIAIILYVWRGAYFTPDRWAILLFITAILLGQWKAFLRDWIPVVLLIFGYEFMHGYAYTLVEQQHKTIHVTEMITADRWMFFGHLPTLWLQGHLFEKGVVHWYDVLAMVMYTMHFVFPLAFAFIVWIGSKRRFWEFSITFLLMSYAGFVIYLFYPAAPPWMASDWEYIHGVQLPFDQVFHSLVPQQYDNLNMVQIWNNAGGNPVAAMPSLHAAYPWMVLLFAVKFFGKKGLILVPYNMALWFAVVYLGDHYVIDILAGMALSTVVFVLMQLAWPFLERSSLFEYPERLGEWWHRTLQRLRPSGNT